MCIINYFNASIHKNKDSYTSWTLLYCRGYCVLSHFGGDLENAKKAMEENYSGCYKSLADYAEELADEASEIPENLAFLSTMSVWGATGSCQAIFTLSRPDTRQCIYSGHIDPLF